MNLAAIFEADALSAAYQRDRCRSRLAELRLARARVLEQLQDLCRRVQRNPALHEPETMSHAVAELKYLDQRTEQLQKILQLAGEESSDDNA